MPIWPFLTAALMALIALMLILPARDAAKLKKQLRQSYGRPPLAPKGLANAEAWLRSYAQHRPPKTMVDDLTWNDLDGDEVYARLNACQSAAGDIWLYTALRCPPQNPEDPHGPLALRRALMDFFEREEALREKARYRLARLGRIDGSGIEMLVFHTRALRLPRPWLFWLLAALPWLGLLLLPLSLTGGILLAAGGIIANNIVSSLVKTRQASGFRSVRYLASARGCALRLAEELQRKDPALAKNLRAAVGGLKGTRASTFLLTLDHLAEESLGFSPLAMLMLPMLAYDRLAAKLSQREQETEELFRLLGEIDLAIATLSTRQSLPGWCTPAFCGQPRLTAKALVHPLIEEAVPNDADLENDVLLTGSNASGKSTFIKAAALNCLLAQTLDTCTAESFVLKPGAVATSMAVADSVVDGDSYFVAEVKSMRRLLRLAEGGGFHWFFIDEILKGTNTVERVAASSAVLHWLHGANCLCFAATHDVELTRMLDGLYRNYHFSETVDDSGVWFDYKLRPGPATSRNAILLLEKLAFPARVTHSARQLAATFEQQGEWQKLQEEPLETSDRLK